MRKVVILVSLLTSLTSCTAQKEKSEQTERLPLPNPKQEIEELSGYLSKYRTSSQTFTVSSNKPSQVKGKQGTILYITPGDYETVNGQPVGESINVELIELTNQKQLLRNHAQTLSNGRLLVSGGAYYLNMTSGGEQLKLKEGRTLSVQFSRRSAREMDLFYGQPDSLKQFNWQPGGQKLKSLKAVAPVEEDLTETKPLAMDTLVSADQLSSNSGIEAVLAYVDSESKRPLTRQEKKRIKAQQASQRIVSKMYQAIELNQLGWINIDRFYEEKDKTDLRIVFPAKDSITNAMVYLVFKDINSLVTLPYYAIDDKTYYQDFAGIPVGARTRLIAFTLRNGKPHSYTTDLTIRPGQTLIIPVKRTTEEKLGKLFNIE
jgi:hypothetical protein